MEQTAPSTEYIIAKNADAILRKPHLNRDIIIGWIGERGGGKSTGAAAAAQFDWGLEGNIIRSNMKIACDITVSEEVALIEGCPAGNVHYESEELNKHKFLTFSPEYKRSCFVIDEINLWLADARRTMSTQNLLADDVAQQLRKWEAPLYYTCIHEMFVDSRIRDMTDLFIKTEDTALTENGLRRHQRQGLSFHWKPYPMTKKYSGHTFAETHEDLGVWEINGRMLWGLIDTLERQERKKYKPEEEVVEAPVHIIEDGRVIEERSKWGWLYDKILDLHKRKIPELEDEILWEYLEVKQRGIPTNAVGRQLKVMGIVTKRGRAGHFVYEIDGFDLNKDTDVKEYALV